ncbi:MAG: nucleotidyltransferase domain-containing protein [Sulfolobaceae archaeon]
MRRWREYAEKVAKAVHDIDPTAEVYVIGGVAEDRITVLSDIDVLIVMKRKLDGKEKRELRKKILFRAMDFYDLPFDAPVELHVEDEEGEKKFTGKRIKIT